MKILQLVTQRQYRGAEVFAANLSNDLIALNHEVLFVGLYKPSENPLFVKGALNIDLSDRKSKKFSLLLVIKLYSLIKDQNPEIIQANGSDTLKYAVFANLFFRKKVIYRNISVVSKWVGGSLLKFKLNKLMINQLDHITSVGSVSREDFIRTYSIFPEKISVIRRGIPIVHVKNHEREELKKNLGIPNDTTVLIHVGKFSREKNHAFLIRSFYEVKKHNNKVHLLLVGDGPELQGIRELITSYNLNDSIQVLGYRTDVQCLLSISNICVLCSLVEGVPGVIMEAAAQRKPSIAIDVGGVGEVVLNGETGLLVENHDIDLFQDAICQLINKPDLIRRMGENAYNLVYKMYSPEQTVEDFIKLYRYLLSQS